MLVTFNRLDELKGWKLYDYEMVQSGHSCKLCGHTLTHIFKIRNGDQISELGSECVKKVAATNQQNSMEGVTKLPKEIRKQIKNNKKEMTEEEEAEYWMNTPY